MTSPSTERVAPDAGEALRLALRAQPVITAITGTRVGLTLTGSDPAIRYALLPGGRNHGGGAASARLQVECWGRGNGAPDDGTADDLARTVVSVLTGMVGTYGQARVHGVSADAPYRSDDTTTGRPRAIVGVSITVSPTPPGG
jgi:hypothetical protein